MLKYVTAVKLKLCNCTNV